jgi:hypothetical protein
MVRHDYAHARIQRRVLRDPHAGQRTRMQRHSARGAFLGPGTWRPSQVLQALSVKNMQDVLSIRAHERGVGRNQFVAFIYSLAADGALPRIQILDLYFISTSKQSRNVRLVVDIKYVV